MRRNLIILLAVVFGSFFGGCAGVSIKERAEKGLLQRDISPSVPLQEGSTYEVSQSMRSSDFIWPVKQGQITSLYGSRRRDFHEGIDIRAQRGTTVFASKAGTVIYASRKIHGYGNMIVLRHSDETSTVYAHNRANLVRKGQSVFQGQVIAEVGATGKATGPHLHFEIRKGEMAQDPLLYLPQIKIAKHNARTGKSAAVSRQPAAIE